MNRLGLALTVMLGFVLNLSAQVPSFAAMTIASSAVAYSEEFPVFTGAHLYTSIQVASLATVNMPVEYQVSYQRTGASGTWYAPPTPALVTVAGASPVIAEDSLVFGDGELWMRYKLTNSGTSAATVLLRAGLGGVAATDPFKDKTKLFARTLGKEATLTVAASGTADSAPLFLNGFDAASVFLTNSATTGTYRFLRSAAVDGPYYLLGTTSLASSQYGVVDSLGGGDQYYKVRVANSGGSPLTSVVRLFPR